MVGLRGNMKVMLFLCLVLLSGCKDCDDKCNQLGFASDMTGISKSTLVTPEPSTWALLSIGLGILVLRRKFEKYS